MEPNPPQWLAALLDPARYPHPVADVNLVETHISWVALTGEYAYKFKKPVDFGFLNFSTLSLRHHYCCEELRLNRRLAPDLYLDVVPVTGSPSDPQLGGAGEPWEYAVKMRQFAAHDQLDALADRGELSPALITDLARRIAGFHGQADRAGIARFGTPLAVAAPMLANIGRLRQCPVAEPRTLDVLEAWIEEQSTSLASTFERRRRQGCIRECHGDLHLGNITLYRGQPTAFDCIEFNDELRWIDVMSDVAFLLMDLEHRNLHRLAWRFLNIYLENTGDYAGLSVLRFYQVYRATVRAKVEAIRLGQLDCAAQDSHRRTLDEYLQLALTLTRPQTPALVITSGLSGSGKTTFTTALMDHWRFIRIRSDVERKRLHGLAPLAASGSATGAGMYTADASQRTYDHLFSSAAALWQAGYAVVLDATFLSRRQRDAARNLARRNGVPFLILEFAAGGEQLRRRIRQRRSEEMDASEATESVLDHQLASREPLSDDELADVVTIQPATPVEHAARCITERLPGSTSPVSA